MRMDWWRQWGFREVKHNKDDLALLAGMERKGCQEPLSTIDKVTRYRVYRSAPPNPSMDTHQFEQWFLTLKAPHEKVRTLIGLRERYSAHKWKTDMYSSSLGTTT